MRYRTAQQHRDDRLLNAIDELFRTLDDERVRAEDQEREGSRARAEALQRRLALAFHDLGVGELTYGWTSVEAGQLRFTDLDTRRAERLVLALKHVAHRYTRFQW
jgi:hypothetical protein